MPTALGTVASHRTGSRVPLIPTVGLQLWLDADDASTFSYSSGVAVSEWRDKSGNGMHFTGFAGVFNRNGTQNGHTCIVSTIPSSLRHQPPIMTVTDNFTIIVAYQRDSTGDSNAVFGNGDTTGNGYSIAAKYGASHYASILRGGLAWEVSTTPDLAAPTVQTMSRTSGIWGHYVDGVATSNNGMTGTLNTPVWATYVGDAGQGSWQGSVYEVIVYNRAISSVERTEVETYLRRKWILNTNNPFTLVPWHAAYWASDPLWTPPADGAAVTTWRDGSGHGWDMTTTGGPLYRAASSVLNGKPAVELAPGKGAVTAALTPSVPQSFTMVGVYYSPTTADGYAMGAREGSTYGMSVGFEGGNWFMRSNSSAIGSPATAGRHYVRADWAGYGISRIVVDGVAGPAGIPNNIMSSALKWTIGSSQYDSFGASGQATYAFVGFKAGLLTDAEQADLQAWAQRAYGTPAPPAPQTISGLAAWYDANDPASIDTVDNNLIWRWRDKTANGYHLLSRQDSYRPSRNGTSISGRTTVVYNDGHKLHSATGASAIGAASQAVTVISVFKTVLPHVTWTALPGNMSTGTTGAPLDGWDGNRYVGPGGAVSQLNNIGTLNSKTVQTWTVYAQTLYMDGLTPRLAEYINGTAAAVSTFADAPLPTANQVINIGSREDNVTMFRGEVAEVLIYNRVLTTAERNKIVAYLDTKWNTWTPSAPIPSKSMIGWWDADDASSFTYASGSLVQTWADKSKAGNHLTSPAGSEPSRTGSQNGHVSIDYTAGTKKVLENLALTEGVGREYAYTLFMAFKKTGASNTYEALPINVSGDYWGTSYVAANMPTCGARNVLAATSWEVWTHVVSSPDRYRSYTNPAPPGVAEQSQYVNGALMVSYSSPHWDWQGGTTAAVSGSRTDRSTQFTGEIGEILLYNRKLPEIERKQVEAYLMAKWAPVVPAAGLQGWWDAADTTTITFSSGNSVSQWRDKSGNGKHADWVNSGWPSALDPVGMNGRPAMDFRASGMQGSLLGNLKPVTIFAAVKTGPLTANEVILGQNYNMGHGGLGFQANAGGKVWLWVQQVVVIGESPTPLAADTSVVLGATYAADNSWAMYFNGAPAGSGATAGTPVEVPISLGAGGVPDNTTWKGRIGEVIVYDRVLTTAERQQAEIYLAKKWLVPADNSAFNPLSINWHSAWWASDPGWTPPADGAGVSSWRNAGTDAKHATQAVSGTQPTYRAAYANLNNRPALVFNGNNWLTVTSPTVAGSPNHWFIVGWLDPAHGNPVTLVDGAGGRNLIRNQGSGGKWQLYAGGSIHVGVGQNGPFMGAALFSGPASHVRENGIPSETGDAAWGGFNNTIIGTDAGQGSNGAYLGGIAFIGAKSGAPFTAVELANLEAWAASYYGVPL